MFDAIFVMLFILYTWAINDQHVIMDMQSQDRSHMTCRISMPKESLAVGNT